MLTSKDNKSISRSQIRKIIDSHTWYQNIRFGFLLETGDTRQTQADKVWREGRYWARKVLRRSTREQVLIDSLPDVSGKRVIDVGCNAGVKSVEASCRGARFVLGVDKSDQFIQQAKNVAEIFKRMGRPIGKIEFRRVDDINNHLELLSNMDALMACCVLYHLGPLDRFREGIRRSRISTLILQGNTARLSRISKEMEMGNWGNSLCDIKGIHSFCDSIGFQVETVACPKHQFPVVIAARRVV